MLILITLTIIFLVAGSRYGIQQTPKQIRQTFQTMFSGATQVKWHKEYATYRADFQYEGHKKEAQFNKDGKWLRTKTELTIVEVPTPVRDAAREYCDWRIDEVFFYEQARGVTAYYVIEFDQEMSPQEKQLRVRPDGTIVTAF